MLYKLKRKKKIMKKYVGFNVLDLKTGVEVRFNYIKGVDNIECELMAIKNLMKQSGQDRSNFIVSGLIKK